MKKQGQCLVAADGSAQFTDLAAAIGAVSEGGAILLKPGVYRLDRAQLLPPSLTFVGSGIDATIVEIGAGDSALIQRGDLLLEDLTLRRADGVGDLLVCGPGHRDATGCGFEGARGLDRAGVGLRVIANGRATLRRCRFIGNENAGLVAEGKAHLTVKESHFERNGVGALAAQEGHVEISACTLDRQVGDGLRGCARANLSAQGNTLSKCGRHGLALLDDAWGGAIRNTIEDCGGCGLLLDTSRPVEVRDNHVLRSAEDGILVRGEGRAKVEVNTFTKSGRSGMAFLRRAKVLATENICAQNKWAGLHVAGDAHVTANFNALRFNERSGVIVLDAARLVAMRNNCSHNGEHGVVIGADAEAALDRNECGYNVGHGMMWWQRASGTAEGNTCEHNGQHGLLILGHARPMLSRNTCRDNKASGLAVLEGATPRALANTLADNAEHGVLIGDDASPTLEDNTCTNNKKAGLCFRDRAVGLAQRNSARANGVAAILLQGSNAAPTLTDNDPPEATVAPSPTATSTPQAASLTFAPGRLTVPLQRPRRPHVSMTQLVSVHGFGPIVAGMICMFPAVMALVRLPTAGFLVMLMLQALTLLGVGFWAQAALKVARARALLRHGVVVFGAITDANPETREIHYAWSDPSGRSHRASIFLNNDAQIDSHQAQTRIALLTDPERPGEVIIPSALGVHFEAQPDPEDRRPEQLPAPTVEPLALVRAADPARSVALRASLDPVRYGPVVRALSPRKARVGHLTVTERGLTARLDAAPGLVEILWERPFVVHLSVWLTGGDQAELNVSLRALGAERDAPAVSFKTRLPQRCLSARIALKQEHFAWISPEDFAPLWSRIVPCAQIHGEDLVRLVVLDGAG